MSGARNATVRPTALAGYGVGDFGLNLYWSSLSLLLFFWYTDVVGISPATAGVIFFVGTLWDAATDPTMAALAERTRTRWGAYRPFIAVGGAGLGASFVILFGAPLAPGGAGLAGLIAAHLLFRTCYTVVAVPYSAMAARLTADSRERTLFSGVRMGFAFGGHLAVSACAFPLVRWAGDGDERSAVGFVALAVACAAGATACLAATFALTNETPPPVRALAGRWPTRMARAFAANAALCSMLIVIALQAAAMIVFQSALVYLLDGAATDVHAKERQLTVNAVAALASVPAWTWLAHRFGKRRVWVAASALFALAGARLAFSGGAALAGAIVEIVAMAVANAGFGVLIWSMIPDTIEYGEWLTGARNESAAFGLGLLVQKTAIGLGALGFGLALEGVGYADPAAFDAVAFRYVAALVPSVLIVLSAVAAMRHPVTRDGHAEALAAIQRRG
ncbi:MAG: MFS transporter [Parvularculaceae bacterium]